MRCTSPTAVLTGRLTINRQACVLVNNIEAAKQELDKLYSEMAVDVHEEKLGGRSATTETSKLFSIKIVQAEFEEEQSNAAVASDVIISNESGHTIHHTRQVYAKETARCELDNAEPSAETSPDYVFFA